jgi:phage shock protein A
MRGRVVGSIKEFLEKFGPGESGSPTDPASANNMMIEAAIEDFQEAVVKVTETLAELSAEHEAMRDSLDSYRTAVTEAYVAAMEGDADKCKKVLQKVVNT